MGKITKNHQEKIRIITERIKAKYKSGEEIWTEDLKLLIEETLNISEQSAKAYIRDLFRRGIIEYVGRSPDRYKWS